jgi:hypothetical protein
VQSWPSFAKEPKIVDEDKAREGKQKLEMRAEIANESKTCESKPRLGIKPTVSDQSRDFE